VEGRCWLQLRGHAVSHVMAWMEEGHIHDTAEVVGNCTELLLCFETCEPLCFQTAAAAVSKKQWVTCQMDGIPERAEYFLGVKIQNFSSASNRVFSL
jgi:hypothetical protein